MTERKLICGELLRKIKRCDLECMSFDTEGNTFFDYNECGDSKHKKLYYANGIMGKENDLY